MAGTVLLILELTGCPPGPTADKAPGAPTGLTATPTVGEVTLTWQTPTDTGIINGDGTAGTITAYTVYYSTTQGFAIDAATGVSKKEVGNVLTATIDGLTNSTTYYFKVTASNTTGESDPSAEANTLTNPPTLISSAVFKDGIEGVDGLDTASSVAVSQDGKNVYVAGYNDNALTVFNRDTTTGALTYSAVIKNGDTITGGGNVNGLNQPLSVTVSEDGKNVYVGTFFGASVAVFNRDTSTGALTYSDVFKDSTALAGVYSVVVSPDGNNVYAVGELSDALVVFDHNTTTGEFTKSAVIKDNDATGTAGVNVDGLERAASVAVSQDGKNVYVSGWSDDALAVFNRNTSTGALSYSTVFKDESGGVDGLDGAQSVAVSRDGKNVYVAGGTEDALAVFNRDTSTGALTFSTVFKDGDALTGGGNVDGLDGAHSVAVSQNGENVYVAGYASDALAVFTRDTSTGALTFSTVIRNDALAGNSLDIGVYANTVAVSPDGKNIYVTGSNEDALAVFTWK